MNDKYQSKTYIHFDYRLIFQGKVENYVKDFKSNPHHNFLPLIYDEITFEKFVSFTAGDKNDYLYRINTVGVKTMAPVKSKVRPIMYASHMDNFIYKYYGVELNKLYNKYLNNNNFSDSPVAYRTDKKGKCNIHFAAEVINFIQENKGCYVYIGDFSSFFDTLDHRYLKNMISNLYSDKKIPDHQYRIYKSLTKYSYVNKRDINYYTSKKRKIYTRGKGRIFNDMKDFRNFKKRLSIVKNKKSKKRNRYSGDRNPLYLLKKTGNRSNKTIKYKRPILSKELVLRKNTEKIGIPQGTAISAIYSNIYMLDIDKYINELVFKYCGMYRRYSDDYIIILPNVEEETFYELKQLIEIKLRNEAKLVIHPEKIQVMKYENNCLIDIETGKYSHLDYLGFTYDGVKVKMREKSIYKYYRTAYKLIEKGEIVSKKRGFIGKNSRLTYKRSLYQGYHLFGERTDKKYNYKPRLYGTFITYAFKSQRIFKALSPNTENMMSQQIASHQNKIKKEIIRVETRLKKLK